MGIFNEQASWRAGDAGNYVYKNGELEFFNQPEGYVEKDDTGYTYVYQFKDHLGNIRLSYKDANKDGSITQNEIVQEKNYYPFGLQHKGYNNTITGRGHDYDFLGQERQNELGLNWLTFRHRNYMPEIGRFFGVDPVAGDYVSISTYQFAHNNPISKVELEGLEGHQLHGVDVVNAPPSGRGSQNPAAHIPLPVGNQSTSSNGRSSSSGNTSASNDKNLRIAAAMMAQRTGGDADYYYNAMKDDNYVSNRVGDNIDAMTMFPIGLGGVFSNGVKRTIQNATKRIIGNKVDDIIEYSVKVAGDDIATSGTAKLSKSGVLELDFNVPDGMKGQGIGTEMFDDVIKTFGDDIQGIKGTWVDGDNLSTFQKVLSETGDINRAIFSTPTGKWAQRNGFDQATITGGHVGENGYEGVEIMFNRSN